MLISIKGISINCVAQNIFGKTMAFILIFGHRTFAKQLVIILVT